MSHLYHILLLRIRDRFALKEKFGSRGNHLSRFQCIDQLQLHVSWLEFQKSNIQLGRLITFGRNRPFSGIMHGKDNKRQTYKIWQFLLVKIISDYILLFLRHWLKNKVFYFINHFEILLDANGALVNRVFWLPKFFDTRRHRSLKLPDHFRFLSLNFQ